jgi:hypothetical protein
MRENMSVYGKTAVKAVELFANTHDIQKAWTEAVQIFTNSHSARMKGCPKNAFCGLCRAGLIKGISVQSLQKEESKNAEYAIIAVNLLKEDASWANKKTACWEKIQEIIGEVKKHNSQLDVVISLWNKGLIQ